MYFKIIAKWKIWNIYLVILFVLLEEKAWLNISKKTALGMLITQKSCKIKSGVDEGIQ